jgi:hypothetical protein
MHVRSSVPTSQDAGPGEPRPGRSSAGVLAAALLVVIVASILGFSKSVLAFEPLAAERIASIPVAARVRSVASEPARHHCRCGTECGGSCCCNRRGSGPASTIKDSAVLLPPTGVAEGVFGQTRPSLVEHARPGRHPSSSSATSLDTGPCVSRSPWGGGTISPVLVPANSIDRFRPSFESALRASPSRYGEASTRPRDMSRTERFGPTRQASACSSRHLNRSASCHSRLNSHARPRPPRQVHIVTLAARKADPAFTRRAGASVIALLATDRRSPPGAYSRENS